MKNKDKQIITKTINPMKKKNSDKQIDISFIIVSYNAKGYLINCIKSMYDTTKELNIEIIVVDNSSMDGSAKAVEIKFPEVIVIKQKENLGFAKANNIGIKIATGKYLCLVNSDVKILSACIQKLYDYIEKHPNIGMIAPKTLNGDGTLQKAIWKFPSVRRTIFAVFGIQFLFPKLGVEYGEIGHIKEVDCLAGSFWMIPQHILKEVGLLDERFFFYGEDIDWCKRFHVAKYKVIVYPDAEIIHFGRASYCVSTNAHNPIPVKYKMLQDKAQLLYWHKYYGIAGKSFYWVMLLISNVLRIIAISILYLFLPSKRIQYKEKILNHFKCINNIFLKKIS